MSKAKASADVQFFAGGRCPRCGKMPSQSDDKILCLSCERQLEEMIEERNLGDK